MKYIIAMSIMAFSLSACQTSNLSGKAHSGYSQYASKANHKAFFVHQSIDGGFVYAYIYNQKSRTAAYTSAQKTCNKQFERVNFQAKCLPYDIDNIKVSSMSHNKILALLDKTSSNIKKTRIDIFRKFGDGSMVFKGTMNPTPNGKSQLVVSLAEANCTGEGIYIKGKYNTDTLPQGTWSLNCNDGTYASGTYKSTELHTGEAIGINDKGEEIKLVYRPNDL